MGYMGLNCCCDSDMASGLAWEANKTLAKILTKALKEVSNQYNTGGIENVSLYLEEHIKDASSSEDLSDLVKLTIEKMVSLINVVEQQCWVDKNSKKWHLKAYRRMLKALRKIPVCI